MRTGTTNPYTNKRHALICLAEARKKGIEGRVFVEFIVEKDGEVSNIKVIKGIGYGCDEEALKAVSSFTDWQPGVQRGKPVRQKMVMPITFKMYVNNTERK